MNRATSSKRIKTGRRGFILEPLECRQLMSLLPSGYPTTNSTPPADWSVTLSAPTTPLWYDVQSAATPSDASLPQAALPQGLVTTVPGDGEVLRQSPNSLVITFNPDLDWFPLDLLWQDGMIQLDRVNGDGTTTPSFDANSIPIASVTSSPNGWQVAIPLSAPLGPGRYRITVPGNPVMGMLLGTEDDQALAEFSVEQPGVTLNDAVDLGTVGPQVQTVSGSLSLAGGKSDVALYKVTLAPGHYWRLGLQLDSQRIGSSLLGALALFDQSGQVLATRNAGSGRPDFHNDPYLFAGLAPGVYYIGVSGAGNLPGQPGGYDPVTGTSGNAGMAQAGGAFNLEFVADPADNATLVTSVRLDRADPLDSGPTGLTLTFSGPIDTTTLRGLNNHAVQAVDADGRIWTLTLSGYQEQQNLVSFVFDQKLPPGSYSLVIPAEGGLTDLAGHVPITPGLPAGVLARWTVTSSPTSIVPNNLGTLWPSMSDGVSNSTSLSPGRSLSYRFVVVIPGQYVLQTVSGSGQMVVFLAGPEGLRQIDSGSPGTVNQVNLNLTAGVHWLQFIGIPPTSLQLQWSLKALITNHESLLDNGVGQGPALNLRLLTGGTGSSTGLPSFTAAQVEPAGSVGTSSNSALIVTLQTNAFGRPSLRDGNVSVVGPTVAAGSISLADSSPGLLQGIQYSSAFGNGRVKPDEGVAPDLDGEEVAISPDQRAEGDLIAEAEAPSLESNPEIQNADVAALLKADRLTQLAAMISGWFQRGDTLDQDVRQADGETEVPTSLASAEPARTEPGEPLPDAPRCDRIDHAELGVPTTLILVSAAAYRLRQLSNRWWRRRPVSRPPHHLRGPVGPRGPSPRSITRMMNESTQIRIDR